MRNEVFITYTNEKGDLYEIVGYEDNGQLYARHFINGDPLGVIPHYPEIKTIHQQPFKTGLPEVKGFKLMNCYAMFYLGTAIYRALITKEDYVIYQAHVIAPGLFKPIKTVQLGRHEFHFNLIKTFIYDLRKENRIKFFHSN